MKPHLFYAAIVLLFFNAFVLDAQENDKKMIEGIIFSSYGKPHASSYFSEVGGQGYYTDSQGRFRLQLDKNKVLRFWGADGYKDIPVSEYDFIVLIYDHTSGKIQVQEKASKDFTLKNPWTLPIVSNSENVQGVGVFKDESPRYAGYINPEAVRKMEFTDEQVKIEQEPLRLLRRQGYGFELNFKSIVGVEQHTDLPSLQSEHAQGRSVDGSLRWNGPDAGEIFSWGPSVHSLEYDGSSYDFDKNGRLVPTGTGNGIPANSYGVNDFFQTGFSVNNSIQLLLPGLFSGFIETNLGQNFREGAIRNSGFESYNASLAFKNMKFGHDFRAEAGVAYNLSKGDLLNRGSNMASLLGSLFTTPPTFDNSNGMSASNASQNNASWELPTGGLRTYAPGKADNPYALLNVLPDNERGTHFLSNMSVNYEDDYYEKFKANLSGSFQRLTDDRTNGTPPGFAAYNTGRLSVRNAASSLANLTLTPEYSFYLDDYKDYRMKTYIDYRFNYEKRELDRKDGFGFTDMNYGNVEKADFIIPGSSDCSRVSNELKYGTDLTWREESSGILQLSAQHYFSNTANSYSNFFPYAGIRINWNDFMEDIFGYNTVNMLSVIASAGRSIHETPLVYENYSVLSTHLSSDKYNRFYESEEIYPVKQIKPEILTEYSAGISAQLFRYNIFLDAGYFNITTSDFAIPVFSTGKAVLDNVGKINNSGFNVTVSYAPYRGYNKNFNFGLDISWAKSVTTVKDVYLSEKRLPLAGFRDVFTAVEKGQPLGSIYGTTWLRDEQGRMVIDEQGFPIKNNRISKIGNPTPDWISTVRPKFRWKDVSFDFIVEFRKGGDVWNGTQAMLDYVGMSQITGEERNIKGYVFPGATMAGQTNTTPVDFYNPAFPVDQNRWVRYGTSGVGEEYICDASWIRLSEMNLLYSFKLRSRLIRDLSVGITGNNILLFTKYKGVDPASSLFNYTTGKGIDLFNMPGVRTWLLTLKMKIHN